nr:MAG TPA: hypothetical protein [Caudoviricetes sp.]
MRALRLDRLSIRAWTLHRVSWRVSRCACVGNITVLPRMRI